MWKCSLRAGLRRELFASQPRLERMPHYAPSMLLHCGLLPTTFRISKAHANALLLYMTTVIIAYNNDLHGAADLRPRQGF